MDPQGKYVLLCEALVDAVMYYECLKECLKASSDLNSVHNKDFNKNYILSKNSNGNSMHLRNLAEHINDLYKVVSSKHAREIVAKHFVNMKNKIDNGEDNEENTRVQE